MKWVVLHHFLALNDEVSRGYRGLEILIVLEWSLTMKPSSCYGLRPSLVICLKLVEGNAFGLPTTIKQS